MARSAAYLGDLLLVESCRGGEEAAASELFRTHQRRVYSTLYRVLGSSADIDDLLQETFIQVFRSLHGYRGEAKLATWIDRIAARVAYRHIGKRRRRPSQVELHDEDATAGPEPIDQVAAREGVERLYAALDRLSPALRVAFALFEIDGRSVAEVAELLGTSKTTAKVRVWRARKSLLKSAERDPILSEFLADTDLGRKEAA